MKSLTAFAAYLLLLLASLTAGCSSKPAVSARDSPRSVTSVPGMPRVVNPSNLYSEAGPNMLSSIVSGDLPRVYVPNVKSNDVYVIDPSTYKVVECGQDLLWRRHRVEAVQLVKVDVIGAQTLEAAIDCPLEMEAG